MIHSLTVYNNGTANSTVTFPKSGVIIVGFQSQLSLLQIDLGHGIYAYLPTTSGILLSKGGFLPAIYQMQGTSLNIVNTQGSADTGLITVYYVTDKSEITGEMKNFPLLHQYAGVLAAKNNIITIPASTAEGTPSSASFTVNMPASNMTLIAVVPTSTIGKTLFLNLPDNEGLPYSQQIVPQSYNNIYPFIPINYFSKAESLTLSLTTYDANSGTAAITEGAVLVIYYDILGLLKTLNGVNPFNIAPVAPPKVGGK